MPAAVTYPLRQAVLRPHETVEAIADRDDDDESAASFAALSTPDGAVLGTATVRPEAAPADVVAAAGHEATGPVWRLRGMATVEGRRGEGIGGGVLAAAIGHVAEQGGGVLWCNARIPAQRFYERAGFAAVGDPWVDPEIGPHVVMWRSVDAATGAADP